MARVALMAAKTSPKTARQKAGERKPASSDAAAPAQAASISEHFHPPSGDDGAAEPGHCRWPGVIGYRNIPVAALPSYDTPVINVVGRLAGCQPGDHGQHRWRLPLEKQFQTVPGLKTISSTSTLGSTSLTLEFEEGRNIDAAAVDVQAALLRAQRRLPSDMTNPPSYRKVNPADAPVLLIAAALALAVARPTCRTMPST